MAAPLWVPTPIPVGPASGIEPLSSGAGATVGVLTTSLSRLPRIRMFGNWLAPVP
jgi:hypothetical protein